MCGVSLNVKLDPETLSPWSVIIGYQRRPWPRADLLSVWWWATGRWARHACSSPTPPTASLANTSPLCQCHYLFSLCGCVWVYTCACVCVCMCVYAYTCVGAHVCECVCVYVCAYMCLCVCVCMCVCVCACMCVHSVHVHICLYTCMFVCVCAYWYVVVLDACVFVQV